MMPGSNHRNELLVLSLIGAGLILILVLIICGLFGWFESKVNQPLPNWAENVLVALATTAGLKLGDVLAALVQLAAGRQLGVVSQQLGQSMPSPDHHEAPPKTVKEAARRVAGAAEDEKNEIERSGIPRPTFGQEDP